MKKLVFPLLAVGIIAGLVLANSSRLFPDTPEFPRFPTGAGTIGGVLSSYFESDGSAKNSDKLGGRASSGYLQNTNCTDPIDNVWVGVDANGRGICGHRSAVLASIGRFSEIAGTVNIMKRGTSVWVPATTSDDLYPGDIIHTDANGTGTLRFALDTSILRLANNTTLELRLSNLGSNSVAEAILSDGRLWGRVLSNTGISIGGGGIVAGVRGTSIDIQNVNGQYTLTVIDSTNTNNTIATSGGQIALKEGVSMNTAPNTPFGPGTRFIYNSGSLVVHKYMQNKNTFYIDPWINKNTLQDITYMSNLLDFPDRISEVIKTKLNNELNTTMATNDTKTLEMLLAGGLLATKDISNAATLLNEENKIDSTENMELINKRKSDRINCKRNAQTYFSDFSECRESWNTLSFTDFQKGLNLFGKKDNWSFYANEGSVDNINAAGKYLTYSPSGNDFNNLIGKKIEIEFEGTPVTGKTLVDFGTVGSTSYRIQRIQGSQFPIPWKCVWISAPNTANSNCILESTPNKVTFVVRELGQLSYFSIGNNASVIGSSQPYTMPLGVRITKVRISNM